MTLPMSLAGLGARFLDRVRNQGVEARGVERPFGRVFLEEA